MLLGRASLWPGRYVHGRGLGQLIVWAGLGCYLVLVGQNKQTRANSPGQVILRCMTSENDLGLAQRGPLLGVLGAQVLMRCDRLEPSLSFFVRQLGFRLDAIFPADSPSTAMLSGYGLQLRLVQGGPELAGVAVIYLLCDDPLLAAGGQTTLTAPNGVLVKLVAADPPMVLPPTRQSLVVTRADDSDCWEMGRAGLLYRDLLPERHGGAFIASHIRVLGGGPVADYVHFHKIRFQAIFCRKGWVRVVYEGQGEPFDMYPGDCVLQPPLIRHRVLESSPGAEVVEIAAPAQHITLADHVLELPTPELVPQHDFSGQGFVRHLAAQAPWSAWRVDGFEAQDTGITEATAGLAGVRVLRRSPAANPAGQTRPRRQCHDNEFCFYFVLCGQLLVKFDDQQHGLRSDDCITIPAGLAYSFVEASADLQLLEVTLPGVLELQ